MSEPNVRDHEPESARLFDSLFTSHHETVFRYCVRRLGPSEAEDAAADVFAIAWRRLDQIPLGDATRAWLIGVAYKVVGNRFRARRRGARLSQRIASDHSTRRSETLRSDSDTQLVELALERLNSSDQELIRLSAWDGLSRSEIGEVLGIRVNAVDQRLHRARSRLKTHFEQLAAGGQTPTPEEAPI